MNNDKLTRTELNDIIEGLEMPSEFDENGKLVPGCLDIIDKQDQLRSEVIAQYIGKSNVFSHMSKDFVVYEKNLEDAKSTKAMLKLMGYQNLYTYQPTIQDPNNEYGSIVCPDTPFAVCVRNSEKLVINNTAAARLLDIEYMKEMIRTFASSITYIYGDDTKLRVYFNDKNQAGTYKDLVETFISEAVATFTASKQMQLPLYFKFENEMFNLDNWVVTVSFW